MRIETIAVGQPKDYPHNGKILRTAIYKTPIPGPVWIRFHNVEGDKQASPDVHGGKYKAVYVYSAEHYPWWQRELGRDLEPAAFGENLTVSGWDDARVCVGDVYRFGEAELEAVGPRLPCSKLAMKFGDPHFIKRFSDARRWGLYHSIRKEGVIRVGDTVEKIHEHPARVPAYELARVWVHDRDDRETIAKLADIEGLDPDWREGLLDRLGKLV